MKWLNLDYTLHLTSIVLLCCYWIRKFNCVFGYWVHLGKYSLQYNILKWKYISSLKFYEANHQLSLKMFPPKFHLMSYFNSITFWTNNCFWHFIFWIIISHTVKSCFLFRLLEQVWWHDEIIPITGSFTEQIQVYSWHFSKGLDNICDVRFKKRSRRN